MTTNWKNRCLKCGKANTKEPVCKDCAKKTIVKKRYQIVIEGSDYGQVQELFEEIQNKYSLYDNCVMQAVSKEDSITNCCGKPAETGRLRVRGENYEKVCCHI